MSVDHDSGAGDGQRSDGHIVNLLGGFPRDYVRMGPTVGGTVQEVEEVDPDEAGGKGTHHPFSSVTARRLSGG